MPCGKEKYVEFKNQIIQISQERTLVAFNLKWKCLEFYHLISENEASKALVPELILTYQKKEVGKTHDEPRSRMIELKECLLYNKAEVVHQSQSQGDCHL